MTEAVPSTSAASPLSERHQAKKRARHWFDSWAASYDRSILNFFLFRPSYRAMLREIAVWRGERDEEIVGDSHTTIAEPAADLDRRTPSVTVSVPPTFRVLDVGCGTASFAKLLLETPWPVEVVAMDYSPAMCGMAATKLTAADAHSQTTVLAGDSEHLPLADGSVDIITCANSFHHYPRQGAVIREMRRVLRPGGRLILLDGFRDNAIGWFVFDVVVTAIEKDVHHATWREIHTMFIEAGFRNLRRRKFNVLFPVLVTTGDA